MSYISTSTVGFKKKLPEQDAQPWVELDKNGCAIFCELAHTFDTGDVVDNNSSAVCARGNANHSLLEGSRPVVSTFPATPSHGDHLGVGNSGTFVLVGLDG